MPLKIKIIMDNTSVGSRRYGKCSMIMIFILEVVNDIDISSSLKHDDYLTFPKLTMKLL